MRPFFTLFIVFFVLVFSSCENEGKASIFGEVAHHDTLIPNATIYVKFGTNVFPGSDIGVYDISTQANANSTYSLAGLSKGKNYVYATGWDNSIGDSVFGGIPIVIETKKANLEVNVPVTE